ncbi:unnamed protein product, partial [Symbiodinium sp. CCMP2456]
SIWEEPCCDLLPFLYSRDWLDERPDSQLTRMAARIAESGFRVHAFLVMLEDVLELRRASRLLYGNLGHGDLISSARRFRRTMHTHVLLRLPDVLQTPLIIACVNLRQLVAACRAAALGELTPAPGPVQILDTMLAERPLPYVKEELMDDDGERRLMDV